MTKRPYPTGCAAGSQVCGRASSSPYAANPDYAWIVNFHNGNCNDYHRDNNNAFVRAVRGPVAASECHGATFSSLYRAWRAARRRKKPSINQATFEARWADHLVDLSHQFTAGHWPPSPCASFIAQRPKAREIHAPDFGDRVVHHWLIPQLEHAFEPAFSDSSFSNRPGRGTHAAVDRLQRYVRQVHSGQGGGWFLQLDIANFFNRIHRPTLWKTLKRRMGRAGIDPAAQQVAHALLRRSPLAAGVRCMATADQIARVPRHKRLANAPAGCGLPIGNLSSQFFANVYLDALDQFVKHRLKARRYVRYVDDFVLVHASRQQLEQWQVQIERFVADELRLSLKAERTLAPLTEGIDFLGYIIHPTHRLVRQRVISHCQDALLDWQRHHVSGQAITATPEALRHIRSQWFSYLGHFRKANSHRLVARFRRRFPWLGQVEATRQFSAALEGQALSIRFNPKQRPAPAHRRPGREEPTR